MSTRRVVAGLLFAALWLPSAGCQSQRAATTTAVGAPTTETSTTTLAPKDEATGFTYRIGIIGDVDHPNIWAYWAPDGSVTHQYILSGTKPALYRIQFPGIVASPDVAVGVPVDAVEEGNVWTVTQPLRDDYTWSDGSSLTARDIVFTFETVRDVGAIGPWVSAYPYTEDSSPQLLMVEAVDDFTVKYTFDDRPGAAVWPHQVGVAPIVPKAPWEGVVAQALGSDDPFAVLKASDPVEAGDLSGGPVVYTGRNAAGSHQNVRNQYYANAGFLHQFWPDGSYALNGKILYGSGDGTPSVDFTEGPYLEDVIYSQYDDVTSAMLALDSGAVDVLLFSQPLDPTLRRQGLESDRVAVASNPSNGFQYLGFNLRRSPGKFLGFRRAMAYLDKERLSSNELFGAFTPLYVLIPEGNTAWYDSELADEIAAEYRALSPAERVVAAYAALEDDGFVWATPPVFDDEGDLVTPGAGLIDPDGNPVPDLDILAAAGAPTFPAEASSVAAWAQHLGIPAKAKLVDIDSLIYDAVWPGVGNQPDFDMYVLGWSLGNPAWPTFHGDFFHTRHFAETDDGGNSTGYSNPEFDALADAMLTETDPAIAHDLLWDMERMIARDLPYVVLIDYSYVEFYNKDLHYPFTRTLAGLQNLSGMKDSVSK